MTLRWRYLVLGLGFLVVAGVRAAQGEVVWAVVFAVAAGINGWLAVQEAPAAEPVDPRGMAPSEVEGAVSGYRSQARTWQVLGVAGLVLGGALLLVEPPLAVFAAGAALFAVHRAHRAGRAAAALEHPAVVAR